jgi:hypothetical protein
MKCGLLIPVKLMSYRSSESERQFGSVDERPQQVLLPPGGLRRHQDRPVQFVHIIRAVVGQGTILEVSPAVLIGVEFGRIRREEFQMQTPAASQPLPQLPALVRPESVPHHHQPSVQVPQQMAKKRDDLFLADADVHVEPQVPSRVPPAGRDRHPADGRHLSPVPHAGVHEWRMSAQAPRAPDQRLQQKARFIDENKRGTPAGNQTLNARPVVFDPVPDDLLISLLGPTLRLLRGKNRVRPAAGEWRRRGIGRRTAGQSTVQSEARSTGRWQTHSGWRSSTGTSPTPAADALSGAVGVPERACWPRRPFLRGHTPGAIVERCAAWCSAGGQSRQASALVASGQRPADAAAPAVSGFHRVSWKPYRILTE